MSLIKISIPDNDSYRYVLIKNIVGGIFFPWVCFIEMINDSYSIGNIRKPLRIHGRLMDSIFISVIGSRIIWLRSRDLYIDIRHMIILAIGTLAVLSIWFIIIWKGIIKEEKDQRKRN